LDAAQPTTEFEGEVNGASLGTSDFDQHTGLVVVAALYLWSRVSHTLLFWIAFILTRPLGATLGDLLDKPLAAGGLNLSRLYASLMLLAFIAACIYFIPQRPARAGEPSA